MHPDWTPGSDKLNGKPSLTCQDASVTVRPSLVLSSCRLLLFALVAFVVASCGSTFDADVAQLDVDVTKANASADAGEWGCVAGYEPVYSAVADEGFVFNGESYDPLRISICRDASRQFYFYGENLITGETRVLPACQEGTLTWAAVDSDTSYRIIDVQGRDDLSGRFVQSDQFGEWVGWNLRTEVFRDLQAQNDLSNATC